MGYFSVSSLDIKGGFSGYACFRISKLLIRIFHLFFQKSILGVKKHCTYSANKPLSLDQYMTSC